MIYASPRTLPPTVPVACPTCGRPTDDKQRCWGCHDRLCRWCHQQTGSAFIAICRPCEAALEDWLTDDPGH